MGGIAEQRTCRRAGCSRTDQSAPTDRTM
jgi:hypothetical protein